MSITELKYLLNPHVLGLQSKIFNHIMGYNLFLYYIYIYLVYLGVEKSTILLKKKTPQNYYVS